MKWSPMYTASKILLKSSFAKVKLDKVFGARQGPLSRKQLMYVQHPSSSYVAGICSSSSTGLKFREVSLENIPFSFEPQLEPTGLEPPEPSAMARYLVLEPTSG